MRRKLSDKQETTFDRVHHDSVDINNRVIYVTSESVTENGEESGLDFQMSMRFIKNLDSLNALKTKLITVKASNIGGDWWHGLAMYDAMRLSPSPIDYYIFSCACSMGSIVPQSATRRIMYENADMLIHLGDYHSPGHLKAVTSGLKFYNTKTPTMFDIYAKRCMGGPFFVAKKYSHSEVVSYLEEQVDRHGDWWLTSRECLEYGLVDLVI